VECRINAGKIPRLSHQSPGPSACGTRWRPGIRVDSHVYTGYNVRHFTNSMIGKVIAYGDTRDTAIARMAQRPGEEMVVEGIKNSRPTRSRDIQSSRQFNGGADIITRLL